MSATTLTEAPTLHPEAVMGADVTLGRYTEIGRFTRMANCEMGDDSHICETGHVLWSTIGKFTSISNLVRLDPGNHPTGAPASTTRSTALPCTASARTRRSAARGVRVIG